MHKWSAGPHSHDGRQLVGQATPGFAVSIALHAVVASDLRCQLSLCQYHLLHCGETHLCVQGQVRRSTHVPQHLLYRQIVETGEPFAAKSGGVVSAAARHTTSSTTMWTSSGEAPGALRHLPGGAGRSRRVVPPGRVLRRSGLNVDGTLTGRPTHCRR